MEPWQVHITFLEFAEPDVAAQLRTCVSAEIKNIVIVPLFLFQAGHMKRDIPELVDRFVEENQDIKVAVLDAVGYNKVFAQVLSEKLQMGLCHDSSPRAIVLIGRGNRDKEAQSTFDLIAGQLADAFPGCMMHVGYIAGDGMSWVNVLDELDKQGWHRLYLQPYLWFHGRLTEQLKCQVREWQATHPHMHSVQVGEPLGIEALLVDEMTRRVEEVLRTMSDELLVCGS